MKIKNCINCGDDCSIKRCGYCCCLECSCKRCSQDYLITERDLKLMCESKITLDDVKLIKQNSKLTSLKWRGVCFAYDYEKSRYVILVKMMNANYYWLLKSGKVAEVMRNKYHLLTQKWINKMVEE